MREKMLSIWFQLCFTLIYGPKPKVVVFASGSKDGGGSGFEKLVQNARTNPHAWFEVVGVVSNHQHGGVRQRADKLKVPFFFMPGPFTVEEYEKVLEQIGADWVMLSGWLKKFYGMPTERVINIHPGPTRVPFGGPGMHGMHVHTTVCQAWEEGEISHTEVTMHFVNTKPDGVYDDGAVFMSYPVGLQSGDTPELIQRRVNQVEHSVQWWGVHLVVTRQIYLQRGKVYVPAWYERYPHCPKELRTGIGLPDTMNIWQP